MSSEECALGESRKVERRPPSAILVLKDRWEFTGRKWNGVEWKGTGVPNCVCKDREF